MSRSSTGKAIDREDDMKDMPPAIMVLMLCGILMIAGALVIWFWTIAHSDYDKPMSPEKLRTELSKLDPETRRATVRKIRHPVDESIFPEDAHYPVTPASLDRAESAARRDVEADRARRADADTLDHQNAAMNASLN